MVRDWERRKDAATINASMDTGFRTTFVEALKVIETSNCIDLESCALALPIDAMCGSPLTLNCFAIIFTAAWQMYLPSSPWYH
ncbi:hypothetical protein PVK06_047793 [Gossypium arboreum]|uniref:Uncharacterized protein n=1 Tax=Gossypium arboreum TaxID=29729 RepID=A0ABR0MGU7_GOSAR|nr:hypothetical protein PVK06_047793 [Gossypium arboreum]